MAKTRGITAPGQIFIGTSNVVIPGNKQSFPPEFREKSRLNYYSHLFNSVEINSSFYKTPLRSTFEKWRDDVPESFRFSVKLSKVFTHGKDLQCDLDEVHPFLQAADGLANKKGSLLVQFPGKITLEYFNKVEKLLESIGGSGYKQGWSLAVEFRHTSWYIGETTELLNQYKASLVLQDIPKSKWMESVTAAPSVYLRFHGPTGNYRDSYSPQFLADRATAINEWKAKGKIVYAYFNNTIGEAFANAKSLQQLTAS